MSDIESVLLSDTIYSEIITERRRAHEKHQAYGRSCEQIPGTDPVWPAVLGEEVMEALEIVWPDSEMIQSLLKTFRFICDKADTSTYPRPTPESLPRLREELIQVAAMATAYVDAIDRTLRE